MNDAKIGIIMGSQSDWPTMKHAADILKELAVAHECKIVSAHRTPDRMYDYARTAKENGLKAIIAGAGGAAFARHDRRIDADSRAWRANTIESAVRAGFAFIHRANACRCAGRYFGHWRSRCQKCGAAGRCHYCQ